MEMSEQEYKIAKEAHVADFTGGSIHEISMVCASLVSSHMVWTSLVQSKYISADSFTFQFMIYVVPILSCLTLAADYATWVTVGMATVALFISWSRPPVTDDKKKEQQPSDYKAYLTVYRAGTMISTCIAILAVDFQFFPRRFAKVETFGTSLMDVGVGSFVFSSGVVAAKSYTNKQQLQLKEAMLKSIQSSFPILALGFARLILTKGVDYQEHNSEYGLYWNFFFTLGFLPPFVTLIVYFTRQNIMISALVITFLYQFALCQGLEDWILTTPRINLITANKEGICSFFGYLAIFLFGIECGVSIFQKDISNSTLSRVLNIENKPHIKQLTVHLYIYSATMWLLFNTWVYFYYPSYYVSRRMANLPYVFWVIAFNLSLLSLLVLVESKSQMKLNSRGPLLLDSININGLFTFLLANVLTGIINLSTRTIYANTLVSSIINIVYMFIVTIVPWVMWKHYKLRIKF